MTSTIEALELYRVDLGDKLVGFFTDLWNAQEALEQKSVTEDLREMITFLDGHHDGFKEATSPLFADDFRIDELTEISSDDVEDLIVRLCDQCGFAPDSDEATILALATVSALQPRASAAAAAVGKLDAKAPDLGVCPICGAPAALGILRNEGQAHGGSRDLWCSLCDYTWNYPRIKCARCGNVRQDEIEFFFNETDKAHRVYACQDCGGTLKVVDETSLGRFCNPRVEELVLEDLLDAVIAGEGFAD